MLSNRFSSGFSTDAIFNLSHLGKPVTQHLTRVYGTLSTTAGSAFLGAFLVLNHLQYGPPMLFTIGLFLSTLGFVFMQPNKENYATRAVLLHLSGFCAGASVGPLVQYAYWLDRQIVFTALFGALGVFASFSAAAIWSRNRKFLYMGGLLMTALSTLMWMNIINVVLGIKAWYVAETYISIILFSMFVAFDTQLVIAKVEAGDRDHLGHAFTLFLDAFNIFARMLELLTRKERDRKRRR